MANAYQTLSKVTIKKKSKNSSISDELIKSLINNSSRHVDNTSSDTDNSNTDNNNNGGYARNFMGRIKVKVKKDGSYKRRIRKKK